MGTNSPDPVVLIRSNPLERVDREVIVRVRERMKRIRTGPYVAAATPSPSQRSTSDDTSEASDSTDAPRDSIPPR